MTVPPLSPSPFSHEQVAYCHDPATGLRAIIGIYSTALGPALGGLLGLVGVEPGAAQPGPEHRRVDGDDGPQPAARVICLLYTSDAADEL